MEILLADDSLEVCSALRLLLEQEPLSAIVTEISDMQSLLAHLNESCLDVVLLDWELPGLKCDDIQVSLKKYCPHMKVIAMSSRYEARKEALTAGVDAFISKSEPPEQILFTLRSFVSLSGDNS